MFIELSDAMLYYLEELVNGKILFEFIDNYLIIKKLGSETSKIFPFEFLGIFDYKIYDKILIEVSNKLTFNHNDSYLLDLESELFEGLEPISFTILWRESWKNNMLNINSDYYQKYLKNLLNV